MAARNVLVTGASGFIGRHALPALVARGFEVHAVARAPREAAAGVRWHACDLLEPGAAAQLLGRVRPSHLLHLAWDVTHGAFWASPENLRWLSASLALLEEFAQRGGSRVVGAGTCAEYDWSEGHCSELTTPLRPATLYGTAKHALEQVAAAFARQTGTSAAWGRLFHLYGPHEHPDRLVAYVIRTLLADETARCSGGQQVRDYMLSIDAAEAFAALLDSPVVGAVNIASGSPTSVRELVLRIAAELERPERVQFGEVAQRAGDPARLTADVTRLRDELGFRPRHDLAAGLRETIAWWRAQRSAA